MSDRVIRRILKPLVFAASFYPMGILLWEAVSDQFTPFNAIVRNTGFWSLRFLCLTLAITPIRWLTGRHWIVRFRRMIGLFAFFYGAVHTAAYVLFDRVAGLEPSVRARLWDAAVDTLSGICVDLMRPFFAIGLVALVFMAPMAATSTAGMIRRLGGRRWQAVHRLVYPTAVAAVLHTYWPLTQRAPLYGLVLGLVFLLRAIRTYLRTRPAIARTAEGVLHKNALLHL